MHSLHAYFLRPGDPSVPILYEVDRIRDGRSFTTRRVVAIQHGRAIFNLSASFHVARAGPRPPVPMPDGAAARDAARLQDADGAVQGDARRLVRPRPRPIDIRHVDWDPPDRARAAAAVPAGVVARRRQLPDDPVLHACVVTYASDMTLLDTTLLPHGGTMDDHG